MSKARNHWTWTWAIAAAWLCVFTYGAVKNALPASWWFQASIPIVHDAPRGQCPAVTWERDINRHFRGEWTATLQRQNANGQGFYSFYSRTGRTDYSPSAELPDPLTLRWWFGLHDDETCMWPVGTYRLHTLWIITPDAGGTRAVRRTSTPFHVLPSEVDGAR